MDIPDEHPSSKRPKQIPFICFSYEHNVQGRALSHGVKMLFYNMAWRCQDWGLSRAPENYYPALDNPAVALSSSGRLSVLYQGLCDTKMVTGRTIPTWKSNCFLLSLDQGLGKDFIGELRWENPPKNRSGYAHSSIFCRRKNMAWIGNLLGKRNTRTEQTPSSGKISE